MRHIPYLDLRRQHAAIKGELLQAISAVIDSADFILGKAVMEFEENLARYCTTRFAIGVNSGTDALFLALKAYGIGAGDEVITVPNSFLATASAVVASGARPVFVDIRTDLNIDPTLIEQQITARTKAILPVHLTGKPADMHPILAIARKHGLRVIEDAAQAIGAEYHGRKVGALGDVGCFSLHPLKTLNACGDGGAIVTNDEAVYHTLIQLRNIGLKNRNASDQWGYNSRLASLQAAVLNVKLRYLEDWTEARRRNASLYAEYLRHGVQVPEEQTFERAVYHTYAIQVDRRAELQQYLLGHGIETRVHYPIPIHLQQAAAALGYRRGDFPVTERAVDRILSLPIDHGLTVDDITYVAEQIRQFVEHHT